MAVELLAYTQPNPALTPTSIQGIGDLATLWQGQGTYAESLIEYAGRLCYRSTHRMGTAGDFIADRVREGHEDIIEHVVVTVRFTETDEPLRWRVTNRHCEITETEPRTWIVSGNTRVWVDFFRKGIALAALPLVSSVAPSVFAEFGATQVAASPLTINNLQSTIASSLLPYHHSPMRVTLLGCTQPLLDSPTLLIDHGAATFLFEGISRACTHQLVRHRLASYSQESQRYVDMSKGDWQAIVPPAVSNNPAADAVVREFWRQAEERYAELRRLGIRKEDARFLLPNATETRIVATMNFAAWSHFLWLRAVDKAAQWEIRELGQAVLCMLHALAPAVFAPQWQVYQEKFANATTNQSIG